MPIGAGPGGMYYRSQGNNWQPDCSADNITMGDNRDNSAERRYWGLLCSANLSVGQRLSGYLISKKANGLTGVRLSRIGGIHYHYLFTRRYGDNVNYL